MAGLIFRVLLIAALTTLVSPTAVCRGDGHHVASPNEHAEEEAVPIDDTVAVPGGSFLMGCNNVVDKECGRNERAGRAVEVGSFRIDRTEVTVNAYVRCVTEGHCTNAGQGETCNVDKDDRGVHPINCVTWEQAMSYCKWQGKRLPTEEEWEKAARGTDGRKHPWGSSSFDPGTRLANICDVNCPAEWKLGTYDDGYTYTAPVGTYPPGASPFGALDMIGNVQEWTATSFSVGPLPSASTAPPRTLYAVARGGSWGLKPGADRVSHRNPIRGDASGSDIGFRCAR